MVGLCLQYSFERTKHAAGGKGERQRDCIRSDRDAAQEN